MNSRLQIATRIHFLLLRELGEGIRIERLLRDRLYTRDVLLVCDALKSPEPNALATQFRAALESRPVRAAAAAAGAPQAATWAADTSGFGVSMPTGESKAEEPSSPGWLESTWRWIGR